MTIITTWDFEDQVDGQPLTLPAGWTNSGSSAANFVASTDAKSHGSLGARLPAVASSFRRLQWAGASTTGARVLSFYLTPRAFSTANAVIFSSVNGTTGLGDVRINGTGHTVTIRNSLTAVATSTDALTLDTTYRFEWRPVPAGTQELRVYLGDSTTPLFTLTGAMGNTAQTGLYVGLTTAAAGHAADYDSIQIADDWTGPWPSGSIAGDAAMVSASSFGGSLPGSTPAAATMVSATALSGAATVAGSFTYPLTYPLYAAHRGGSPGPEETLYAYQQSYALNPAFAAEGDMWLLSDGGIAFCHDSTIDRTVDPSSPITTGAVTSFTTAQWHSILFAPTTGAGTGTPRPGMTLADLVTEYGPSSGRTRLLVPEINTGQTSAPFIAAIKAAGVADRTIVQSFSLTYAQDAAAAGLESLFVLQSGTTPNWSGYKAAGINHVSMNKTLLTQTSINDAHAAGLKVWVFTVNTTAERDSWLSMGVDAFFTDAPGVIGPVVYSGAATMTSGTSLAGAANRIQSGTSTMTSASVLTAAATRVTAAAATFTSATTLTAAATTIRPVSATFTSGTALTAAATTIRPVGATFTSATTLTTAATVTRVGSATMASGTSLTSAATVVAPSANAATMTSGTALTGATSRTTATAAVMVSATALTGTGVRTTPTAAAMVSGSTLTGATIRLTVTDTVMTSGSLLTATTARSTVAASVMTSQTALQAILTADTSGPTPATRTTVVAAESRVTAVAGENRVTTIPTEKRITNVAAETRTTLVPAQPRVLEVT